jgi:hypothetical protein
MAKAMARATASVAIANSVCATRPQHDGGATLREQPRGSLADAAARPGDGDNLAGDAGHEDLLQ